MSLLIKQAAGARGLRIDGSSFYSQCFPAHKGLRHFPVRAFEDASEGWTRNLHPPGGIILVKPLEISQPQRLEFIQRQDDLIQHAGRYPGRLEDRSDRTSGDSTAA